MKKFLINLTVIFVFNKEKRRELRQKLIRDWIMAAKSFCDTPKSFKTTVKEAENAVFEPVKHVENQKWFAFNFLDIGCKLEEIFLAKLPKTTYIPKWSSYITKDRILLNDLSLEFGEPQDLEEFEHSAFLNPLPKVTSFRGNLAILDSAGSDNYFHWFINILPKLEFFNKSDIKIDKYLVDVKKPYQIGSLKMLGLDMSKVIPVDSVECVKAKNILATNLPSSPGICNKSSLEFLRKNFKLEHGKKSERIFISRRKAFQGRSITNENEILELLKPLGFKDYLLEEMTFEEQVNLFSSAQVVIAPHGAGLTNMVFCPSGTKILEISNPKYRAMCYCILANQLEFDYYNLLGEGEIPEENQATYDCLGNITVDIEKFKRLINLAGI